MAGSGGSALFREQLDRDWGGSRLSDTVRHERVILWRVDTRCKTPPFLKEFNRSWAFAGLFWFWLPLLVSSACAGLGDPRSWLVRSLPDRSDSICCLHTCKGSLLTGLWRPSVSCRLGRACAVPWRAGEDHVPAQVSGRRCSLFPHLSVLLRPSRA